VITVGVSISDWIGRAAPRPRVVAQDGAAGSRVAASPSRSSVLSFQASRCSWKPEPTRSQSFSLSDSQLALFS
jgi:hypothetical protein